MRRTHFQNLDALRFLAFLSVFLFHSFWTDSAAVKENSIYQFCQSVTRIGHLGVNFFFVLSGFLITYLIIEEKEQTGSMMVLPFYMRRILRIWPLYYFIVISLVFLLPALYQMRYKVPLDLHITSWKFLLFLSNFDYIAQDARIPTLNTLWSISIEEQFYLFWPLLFAICPGKKFIYPIISIIALTFTFRYLNASNGRVLAWHTFSVINDMAVGGLLAYLTFFRKNAILQIGSRVPKWISALFYTVTIAACYLLDQNGSMEIITASSRLILSVLFALIIFDQVFVKASFFKFGRIGFLGWLGRITYGLYCYHYLCLFAAVKIGQAVGWNKYAFGVIILDNVLGLGFSILVAYLSFQLVEKKFLRLKPGYHLGEANKIVHQPLITDQDQSVLR